MTLLSQNNIHDINEQHEHGRSCTSEGHFAFLAHVTVPYMFNTKCIITSVRIPDWHYQAAMIVAWLKMNRAAQRSSSAAASAAEALQTALDLGAQRSAAAGVGRAASRWPRHVAVLSSVAIDQP